jgi:hypothetical protein
MRKSSDHEIDDEDYDMNRSIELQSDENWLYGGEPVSFLCLKFIKLFIFFITFKYFIFSSKIFFHHLTVNRFLL